MEIIKNLYRQYLDQGIGWYNGLEQVYQYGVMFLFGAVCLIIMSYFMLSSATK